jgi:ssDNA-binding Zn-finger/Zn-ribbon topoisomerase 1
VKRAITSDGVSKAGPDAPQTGTCPECGGSVHLRNNKFAFFYAHNVDEAAADCPHFIDDEPEHHATGWYRLSLEFIYRTLLDALNGHGAETLTALFSPLAQYGLSQLFDNADAYDVACGIAERVIQMDEEQRSQAHYALRYRSDRLVAEAFEDVCSQSLDLID